jgi:hypothetical protein
MILQSGLDVATSDRGYIFNGFAVVGTASNVASATHDPIVLVMCGSLQAPQ